MNSTPVTQIDARIETAAQSDDPIRELRALAGDVANESGLGRDYDRVLAALDQAREDATS